MGGPPRIFVSAGEVSGDNILAAILAEIRKEHPDLILAGLGGEASARQGLRPLLPLARTAASGVGDVLLRAGFLLRMRAAAFRALGGAPYDLVLLVDYPGLNLGLARRARELGLPVYYVAPPQAWLYRDPARKAARAAASLRGCAVHVLFPHERATFAAAAERVIQGHFLEAGEDGAAPGNPPDTEDGTLLLCPGSRQGALRRNLPAWLRAFHGAGLLPGGAASAGETHAAVLVPGHLAAEASAQVAAAARRLGPAFRPPRVTADREGILRVTRRAFAFPGTMTLELALRGIPAAVVAAADPLTLAAGRRVLRGPWLGLPNLLLGRAAFPEWAGRPGGLTPAVAAALGAALRAADGAGTGRALRELLGPPRGARVAAEACLEILAKRDACQKNNSFAG